MVSPALPTRSATTAKARTGLAIATVLTLTLAGCSEGDGLPRQAVSGTVTFGGKPLESGQIQFQPATEAEGIAAGAIVTAGAYSIPAAEGPVPGKYKVMIFASGKAPEPAEAPAAATNEMPGDRPTAPPTGMIPLRYNLETGLVAEVSSGGPNTFDFTLETK